MSHLRISRWAVGLIVAGTALMLSSAAWADSYTEYSQATLDDMTSKTQLHAASAPDTRTTIGLAEKVDCKIDPSTWKDKDCNVTQQTVEDDTIGEKTWSASGTGGTVSPTTGDSTVLTAKKTPAGVTVIVTVHDSHGKFDDAPVVKTKPFAVIAPNGMNVAKKQDLVPGVAGPPNNKVGAGTKFDCTVLPTTVSFKNATFRENIPRQVFTWPSGNTHTYGPLTVQWGVAENNTTTDTVVESGYNINWLNNGQGFQDFSYDVSIPEEYQNDAGGWVSWLPGEKHPAEFRGADQKARVGIKATNTAYGGWMGPWQ